MVGADAPGGDDDGRRVELEVTDGAARDVLSAPRGRGRADGASHAVDGAAGEGEPLDPVPEADGDASAVDGLAQPAHERLEDRRPGAPDDVEAGHGVPGSGRPVAAPLGPADDREEPQPERAQPGPLLPRRELDVGAGPAPGPVVLRPVEPGGGLPVLPGEVEGVADAEAPLLRGVDEEETAEGPVGLAAQIGRALLVEQQHPAAGGGQLRGGDEPAEAGADDDDVRVHSHSSTSGGHGTGEGATLRAAPCAGQPGTCPRRERPLDSAAC